MFLDRFFEGKELAKEFENPKNRIIPQKRGKKTFVNTVNHGFLGAI